MPRAGGKTHQGQVPRLNSNGSVNAQPSVVPQLGTDASPAPRKARVASANTAKRTVSTSLAGSRLIVAGNTCSSATRERRAPSA